MWILLSSIYTSFGLVISCSVRAVTIGVDDVLCRVSRHAYDPRLDIISFDITSHSLISFDRISHPIIIVDRTSHPIISVDNTHFRWSLKLPNLFFREDV